MEHAQNVHVSVIDGASKRPGTEYCVAITEDGGGNYRVHPLVVSPDERYVLIFGKPTNSATRKLRIFRLDTWAEATVTIASAAQTYLNTATADQLRVAPIDKDQTLLISNQVVAATAAAPTYSITATWRDYGVMVSNTPADNTYHRATAADTDENQPAGFYLYDVDGVTFATARFPTGSGREFATPVGVYDNSANNPQGFKIRCRKYNIAYTTATWTAASRTITKTGAFTNYTFQNGDEIHISAGTGHTPGYYLIESRTSNDAIVLVTNGGLSGADNADTEAVNGVSVEFDVQRAYDATPQPDMYAVAESFQDAFRAAGAEDGLISWTAVGGSAGYFTITSPFRGTGATIISTSAPSAGTDLSTVGNGQFYFAGATVTAGSGSGSLTLGVEDRWTEVSPSGASDGSIDNTTFPVKLLRTAANTFRADLTTPTPRESGDGTNNPTPPLWQKSGTIQSVSVANPSVIGSIAHGRRTGDSLTLAGLSTTPDINGLQTITVLDDDSFTVPVNVTAVADGVGTWTKGGTQIVDAIVHRGRLMYFGSDGSCTLSAARDYFRVYLEDYENIVDSDPISAPIGSREVVNVLFGVDFNGTIIAFGSTRQYEFGNPEALTPSTASWTSRTRYSVYPIRPTPMGAFVYFLGPRTNKSVAWEMSYDGINLKFDAGEISAHARDLLPMSLRSLAAGVNETVLLVLPTGKGSTSKIYVYRTFFEGEQKQQSEWVEYVFDPAVRLVDVCVIDGDAYLLTETTGLITSISSGTDPTITTQTAHGYATNDPVFLSETQCTPSIDGRYLVTVDSTTTFRLQSPPAVTTSASSSAGVGRWSNDDYMIEKLSLSREDPKTGYPYTIHLDRRLELTGSYSAPNTTFTLPFPAKGSTLNRLVRKTTGTVVDLSGGTYSGNTIVVAGDYSGLGYLGRNFDYQLQLSPPYFRDSQGIPDQRIAVLLNLIILAYKDSGDFSVRLTYDDGRTGLTQTFTPTSTTETGRFVAWTRGDSEHITVYLESDSPKQLTIAAYTQEADWGMGTR